MRSINRTFRLSVALIFFVFALVAGPAIANAVTGQTVRVSVNSAGDAASEMPLAGGVISADGRYVVFWSAAANLVPGVGGGIRQVYRHDRLYPNETVLVSAGMTGAAGNGNSHDPSVSEHGDFVVFSSTATDLIARDSNGVSDVFVRDMGRDPARGGAITLVSANSAGEQGNLSSVLSGLSGAREISDDGRYVVFMSDATNFDAVNNRVRQVYRKDMTSDMTPPTPGALERVSVNDAGDPGDRLSQNPSISGNGDTVAFNSAATNLSPFSRTGLTQQVFVREFPRGGPSGPTTLESRGAADTGSASTKPVLSTTGKHLAYESLGVLDSNDFDGATMDVYLRDRGLNTTVLASRSPNRLADAISFGPSISGDGRWVAYTSIDDMVFGSDLSDDENRTFADVFIYDGLSDREDPSVRYVSLNDADKQAALPSSGASVSGDGHFVLFASAAQNLFEGQSSGIQLYVRNLLSNQPPVVDAGPDETVAEGDPLMRTGRFSDLDASTTWSATADLGAGAFPIRVNPTTKQWTLSHAPLGVGTHVVIVSVTDGEGATGSDRFSHTVTNVDPSVNLGAEAFVYFGSTLQRRGGFSDPGSNSPVPQPAETYRATVDYGDGTGVADLVLDGNRFLLDHTYAADGTYVVRVSVSDSNRGVGSARLTVHVFDHSFEWVGPLGEKFVVGRNLPVKFTVRSPDGSLVIDRSVQVDVVDAEGNLKAGPYTIGDQPSRSVTVSGDSYHVNVDTRDLEAGMYTLRVRFSSPTLSGEFTLSTNGILSAVRSRLRDQ